MGGTFRAGVVQTLARLGDLDYNLGLVRRYTEEAVGKGCQLVVFPECMNTGYLFDSPEHCASLAEPVDGNYVQAMADLCRRHGVYLASGMTERDPSSGKIYNSGVLLDDEGRLILHYQKQFLATHDQNWFEFGKRGCPVVDTALGRLGLLICFDGRIPEIARSLALQGAEVILDMANFFAMDQADLWVPARAVENGTWFVAATKSGVERSIYYPGGSMIVSPEGERMAYVAYDTHGLAVAEIEPARARDKRLPPSWLKGPGGSESAGDRFADRRPETYGAIVKPFDQLPISGWLREALVPEESTTKVAAVQSHATTDGASLEAAWEMVDHTAKLGVKVIVLPELFACATWRPDAAAAREESRRLNDHLTRAGRIARKYRCALVLSVVEGEKDTLYPTGILVGPDGEPAGRYRQVHLPPDRKRWAHAGNEFPVFETPFGRVGIILGYDGLFPESTRSLALNGADIIAWPTAWRHRFERELLAVPKAEDNRVYVVCANRTDSPYPGGSFVIPPYGFPDWNVSKSAPPSDRHGAVIPMPVNLGISRQKFMIPKVNMIRNRMVDTYGPILSPVS